MASKTRNEEQTAATAVTAPAALAADAVAASVGAAASSARAAAYSASLATDHTAPFVNGETAQAAAGARQTRARVQEGMERAMKTAEEILAFGQGNFAALVRSGQIWAAGMQDLGKQVAATAQEQIADTMSAFKAIAGAKSVKDAIEAQAALARNTIEKTVAESSRITEASLKLTEQAMAPVAARVSLAVERLGRAA
jgi:phasin family protein